LYNYYRNRFTERSKYGLPLNDRGEYEDVQLSKRAIAYMKRYNTLELPPQFVHRIRYTSYRSQRKYLECEGFTLANDYKNNVALMQNGDVIYCVDFLEPDTPFGPHTIIALKFKQSVPWFHTPCDSSLVGLVTVSQLRFEKKPFSSFDVVSQVFTFPFPNNISNDPVSCPIVRKSLKKSNDILRAVAQRYLASENGQRNESTNKWDVASKDIPKRHLYLQE